MVIYMLRLIMNMITTVVKKGNLHMKDAIQNQVGSLVENQVENQVGSLVGSLVENQVENQVENHLQNLPLNSV